MPIHADDGTLVPPVVYVPAAQVGPDAGEARVRLLTLSDGRQVLPAYTSLDRLIDACGDDQPWILVPATTVDEQRERIGFDVAVLDAELPEEMRSRTMRAGQGEDAAR